MKARIKITLKNGVLDPQVKAIQHALAALGLAGVARVRAAGAGGGVRETGRSKRAE